MDEKREKRRAIATVFEARVRVLTRSCSARRTVHGMFWISLMDTLLVFAVLRFLPFPVSSQFYSDEFLLMSANEANISAVAVA